MASQASGVSIYTIRAWEKRYKVVTPKRKPNGHRTYSKSQVQKLSFLNQLCQEGYAISQIAGLQNTDLQIYINKILKSKKSDPITKIKKIKSSEIDLYISESLTIILMALENYNLDIISKELDKLKQITSPKDFALKIISPIMSELGSAVHRGSLTITHEHALSAIVKFHIGHLLYQSQSIKIKQKFKMIVCGIEGDYHEFGILISSLIAIQAGFNIIYLGPHMPADSLVDAVNSIDPDFVIIGATKVVGSYEKYYLEKYIHKIDLKINTNCKIILGTELPFTPSKRLKHTITHFKTLEEFGNYTESMIEKHNPLF